MSFLKQYGVLLLVAAFALIWVVARACLQSITIDEADSYLLFAGSWKSQWYPSSGNHLLNTALIRLFTRFGLNELTLRMPAIIGAAIYISSAFYLCVLLTKSKLLEIALFVCLVYNPFIFDYLVAARGYSLAQGFLLAALAFLGTAMLSTRNMLPKCAAASICLGLAFSSQFSFAIAEAVTMLLFFVWAASRRQSPNWKLAAACFLPGLAVATAICGHTLYYWEPGQLIAGASSLSETWNSVVSSSFYKLSPAIFNPSLSAWLARFVPYVVLALAIPASISTKSPFARLLGGSILLTLLLHWIAFHSIHVLLPKERTAIYFVVLATLALGAAMAARPHPAGMAALILAAVYFVGCLRLSYFKEWRYNSDAKQIYWILNDLNRRTGIDDPVVEWRYSGVLNFYRIRYRNQSFHEFDHVMGSFPSGKRAYVLYYPDVEKFIQQQGLKTLYYNSDTNAVIAVKP